VHIIKVDTGDLFPRRHPQSVKAARKRNYGFNDRFLGFVMSRNLDLYLRAKSSMVAFRVLVADNRRFDETR